MSPLQAAKPQEPHTLCTYEAVALAQPGRGNAAAMQYGSAPRQYDIVYFGLDPADPADPARGSRWVTFDTGQETIVDAVADLNVVAGEVVGGASGVRLTRARSRSLLGTAALADGGEQSGGWVVREGVAEVQLPAGWSVAFMDTSASNTLHVADVALPEAFVLLAVDERSQARRLYAVSLADPDHPLALIVEGDASLDGFLVTRGQLYYRDGAQIVVLNLHEPGAVAEVVDRPGEGLRLLTDPDAGRLAPGLVRLGDDLIRLSVADHPQDVEVLERVEDLFAHVGPRAAAGLQPRQIERLAQWVDEPTKAADGLEQGWVVFVRSPQSAGQPATLHLYRPQIARITDLGPLRDRHGRPLSRVDNMRFMPSWDVALLAGDQQRTLLQIYQNPLMDMLAHWSNTAMTRDRRQRDPDMPLMRPRKVDSLYHYQENADRTFSSMGLASDGRLYFGVMPHHPTVGSPVFRFDPQTEQLVYYGEFDALADNKIPGTIANMMHEAPVEIDGRLYFTGQDPFYGSHDFPGMTPQNTRYRGSPLLMLDLATDQWQPLGIPIPADHPDIPDTFGGQSAFHLFADAPRRQLYLRMGYRDGQSQWWVMQLDEKGLPESPAKPAAFDGYGGPLVLGADGGIYYPLLQVSEGEQVPLGPPCDIVRFDPDTGDHRVVASFCAAPWAGDVDPRDHSQSGNATQWRVRSDTREGVWGQVRGVRGNNLLVHFDPDQLALRIVGRKPPGRGHDIIHGDRFYMFDHRGGNNWRHVRLTITDLNTGESRLVGNLVDDQGRWFNQLTDAVVTPHGQMVFSGQVMAGPGDPYARRFRTMAIPLDSGLWVIDDIEALWEQASPIESP